MVSGLEIKLFLIYARGKIATLTNNRPLAQMAETGTFNPKV